MHGVISLPEATSYDKFTYYSEYIKKPSETTEPGILIFGINRLSLTVKEAILIFISGRGSAISSAKEGKSGLIYNLLKGLAF